MQVFRCHADRLPAPLQVFMVNTLLRCYFVMKAEAQERTVCEKSVLVSPCTPADRPPLLFAHECI